MTPSARLGPHDRYGVLSGSQVGLSEGLSGHPERHEKCAAFPMGSDAFLHLKRDSRHQRRQREKITLHRPDNPGPTVVSCFTASLEPPQSRGGVPHKQVSELWPEFFFALRRQPARGPTSSCPLMQRGIESPGLSIHGFPLGLWPTHPCPFTVHMETYSASVRCV